MNEIQATARILIHPGKLEEFKAIAEKCIQSAREKDPGTLQYDWFLNDEGTICTVCEKYQDSNSVLAHAANLGNLLADLDTVGDLEIIVCGDTSDELKAATEGMNISFNTKFAGL